ncbi:hypothetical protein NADFUDRAFT_51780 [Nadsonia fulvescens var. elongata DSM 6958]|uniref:YAG7-like dimerisation domain-containing protein n=1 Tax=Nadsonia fulvescens var. elongata DSM 6958 TaxID=857566 RepID=A0A1E3PIE3_9ASCO|nr:hypothetical protein NADFUDRAFT_51780 [Nadsonia fulvescens var. elongata DSM 6958]
MASDNKTKKLTVSSETSKSKTDHSAASLTSDFNDLNETDIVKSYIGKRMRNLRKKKEKLDKYQSIADGEEKGILNDDQKSALLNKEGVTIPIVDLEKLSALYNTQTGIWKAELDQEKLKYQEKLDQQAILIKQQVEEKAKEKLDYLLKFLRAASYRRDLSSSSEIANNIDSSFEHLLTVVYEADESSHLAIDSLYRGSSEVVFDKVADPVTYNTVKDMCTWSPGKLLGIEEPSVDIVDTEVERDGKNSDTGKTTSTPEILFIHQSEITSSSDDESRQETASLSHQSRSQIPSDLESTASPSASTRGINKEKVLSEKKKNQKRPRSSKKKSPKANVDSQAAIDITASQPTRVVTASSTVEGGSSSLGSTKQQKAEIQNKPRRSRKTTNGEPKKGGPAKDKEVKPSPSSKPRSQKPKGNSGK